MNNQKENIKQSLIELKSNLPTKEKLSLGMMTTIESLTLTTTVINLMKNSDETLEIIKSLIASGLSTIVLVALLISYINIYTEQEKGRQKIRQK